MTQGELSYTFDTHSLMWSCRPGQKYFIDEKTELNRGFFNLAEVTSWQEIEERLAPDLRTYRELTAPPELPGISQIHQTTWGPCICVQGWPPLAQHPCPPESLLTQQAPARPLPQTLGGTDQFFLSLLCQSTSFTHGIRGSWAGFSPSESRSGRVRLGLNFWLLKLRLGASGRADSWGYWVVVE